jgi:hypothetical protein
MRKYLCLLGVIGLLPIASVQAQNKMHWDGPGMFVVMHHGDRQIQLVQGDNKLDEPKAIFCQSKNGCLVSFASQIFADQTSFVYPCALVDGVQAQPRCMSDGEAGYEERIQSAFITQGKHTIQTIVNSNISTGTIETWEVHYTIYEK